MTTVSVYAPEKGKEKDFHKFYGTSQSSSDKVNK